MFLSSGAGTLNDPRTRITYEIGVVGIEKVSSMDDVKASDHLMVIVDDIDPGFLSSGRYIGRAAPNGRISYVKNGWFTSNGKAATNGAHEFFHNLGLIDMYEPFMNKLTAQTLDRLYK